MSAETQKVTKTQSKFGGKYLTFRLDKEDFGLEILKVQEIIGMQEITRIPRMPSSVKGVINLRGKVIPVFDLRLKFSMAEADVSRKTCIIVVQVRSTKGDVIMGIIVDEVSEVLEINGSQIEPAPAFDARINTDFILGMAKTETAVKILLDLDRILTSQKLDVISSSQQICI